MDNKIVMVSEQFEKEKNSWRQFTDYENLFVF